MYKIKNEISNQRKMGWSRGQLTLIIWEERNNFIITNHNNYLFILINEKWLILVMCKFTYFNSLETIYNLKNKKYSRST